MIPVSSPNGGRKRIRNNGTATTTTRRHISRVRWGCSHGARVNAADKGNGNNMMVVVSRSIVFSAMANEVTSPMMLPNVRPSMAGMPTASAIP
jgi:hypothetical protein